MRLAVDVGGTFTDLIGWDGHRLVVGKTPTTPDQAVGVLEGARELLGSRPPDVLLHGTTVATNAVLERKGARVALVTNRGLEDVIEIARQDRPSLYDAMADRPEPLVPRHLRFGMVERPGVAGADPSELPHEKEVASRRPEAVAIALLYAFDEGSVEEELAERLSGVLPGVPLSLSSRVAPEFREYERVSTTVLNAYLMPIVGAYLSSLRHGGAATSVLVMRSSGGLMAIEAAQDLPAAVLLSGPAGGAMASAALSRAHGLRRAVSFDMGGTSTDVCRIEVGEPVLTYERSVGGYPCRMPSVAIHTVGAGGGSVAWIDPGGALRVGPRSAGAEPGPASYGRGGSEPTVTDAHVLLGRIGAGTLLGGSVRLQSGPARLAIEGLALSMSNASTALGIVEVADSHMERAVRRVSVEEGADPRDATLVAFGGAGPLHATALARGLEMERVIVPTHAGVFSALGLLLSPLRADTARSLAKRDRLEASIREAAAEVGKEAGEHLRAMGSEPDRVALVLDVRYLGQSHETHVPFRPDEPWSELEARFHREHELANGFARRGDPIEVVTVRAEALIDPPLSWGDLRSSPEKGEPSRGSRIVVGPQGPMETAFWWRSCLPPGSRVAGPAVIEEGESTTYLASDEQATVLEDGSLEVTW